MFENKGLDEYKTELINLIPSPNLVSDSLPAFLFEIDKRFLFSIPKTSVQIADSIVLYKQYMNLSDGEKDFIHKFSKAEDLQEVNHLINFINKLTNEQFHSFMNVVNEHNLFDYLNISRANIIYCVFEFGSSKIRIDIRIDNFDDDLLLLKLLSDDIKSIYAVKKLRGEQYGTTSL